MREKSRITIPQNKLASFCKKHSITKLSLFGSVLRDDFGPDSDIDVLVEFEANAKHSLLDMVDMTAELEKILGRKVDILTRKAVEQSRNYIRRKAILSSLEVIYAS